MSRENRDFSTVLPHWWRYQHILWGILLPSDNHFIPKHIFYTYSKGRESQSGNTNQIRGCCWIMVTLVWRGNVQRMNLVQDRSLIHSALSNLPERVSPLSATPPRCGDLMRNRAWLQSLIKASSGNRPLAGCSFLSLTSCYFVFPLHHLYFSSCPVLSPHLSATLLPVFSLFCRSFPSRTVLVSHPLREHWWRMHVADRRPQGSHGPLRIKEQRQITLGQRTTMSTQVTYSQSHFTVQFLYNKCNIFST